MIFTDLEADFDEVYSFDDVKAVTAEGISLKDCDLLFEEMSRDYLGYRDYLEHDPWSMRYVGERNSLTTPPYMKFVVEGKVLILLFPVRDEFYKLRDLIQKYGYMTFDLS